MRFIQGVLPLVVLVFAIEVISSTVGEEVFHYAPQPKSYSMSIREFHECVACNDNDGARKDFVNCLGLLSEQNRKLSKECCELTYDAEFCKQASDGDINFSQICQNPSKAIEADRCFWKRTDKTTSDIADLRQCKKAILDSYCTTKSGDI